MDLNDDCLLHIMSMLPVEDIVSLRLTHFRFKPLLQIEVKKKSYKFNVNPLILRLNPLATSMDYYRVSGEIADCLELDQVDENVVTSLMPLFTKMSQLILNVPKLKNIQAIKTFPIPKSLKLIVKNAEKSYLNALLIRFAPRLEVLNSKETPRADFGMLQNLTFLEIDGVWLGKKSQFWKNNRTLETLIIHNQNDEEDPEEIFHDFEVVRSNLRDIANMGSLRDLTFNDIGWRNLRPGVIPQFIHVQRLNLDYIDQNFLCPVINGFGPCLTKLRIVLRTSIMVDEIILGLVIKLISHKFPQLDKILLHIKFKFDQELLRPLFALKNLTQCIISFDPTPEFTFDMVKALPKLRHLVATDHQIVSRKLIAYLKKENRRLEINNSK